MLKVGALAKRTRLTVRTLHHYEVIGLLVPGRTPSGHRVYDQAAVERLHQIVALRQLGFGLDAIRDSLNDPALALPDVLERQLAHVRAEQTRAAQLAHRLERLLVQVRQQQPLALDDVLHTIEATVMYEKYYTPEQLADLKARADALGPEGMQQAQQDWADLIAEVQVAMDEGIDPSSERALALGQRWNALIEAFTGGNAGIRQSLANMYQQEGTASASQGAVDPAMMQWLQPAMEAASSDK
ncbi:MAG: MerR family transcriptional regulator [Bacteroidota bacterium]